VFGRFTSLTKPGDSSPSLTVSYQNSPFVVTLNQVIDATHTFTVTRNYDGLGRQYLTNTNGVLVNSTFNAFGKPVTQSTPHSGNETVYYTITTYDALGRALTVTAPDGTVITTIYDGLTTTVIDANSHSATTVTNILGRTLSVTPSTGPAVTYTYDALGNMLTASRGGVAMTQTYDNAGRKLTMSDPDLGNWIYNYDALAMTSQTDARGCVTNFGYDLLGRPTSKTYSNCPSTPSVAYTYDSSTNGIGRRVSMSVSGGDYTSWNYDIRGRVTSENKQIPGGGQFTTSYTYNSADLQTSTTYPDGEVVNFTYNNQMLLNSVIGTSTYVQSTAYDSSSRIISRALGNGLSQNYTYYPWNQQGGRLQTLSTGSLQNFTYQYDPVGNITSIADSVNSQTQTFTYDALDRLVTAGATGASQQGGYATETYTYNATTGNLDSKAGANYTYNSGHAHAVSSLSNGNTYTYDANGNMITRHVGTQMFNFSYDAENRLVLVSGDSTASFIYDADGARVKSVVDEETDYFVGGHFEKTDTGVVTKYYIAGTSRVAMRKDGTVSYLLADHLGSTSLVTDASGNRTSELRYKPWGETRFSFGAMPTKYTYTGQFSYMDDPSTPGMEGFGLMYYNARWYDSSLSRFAQADTIVPDGPQGYDRYAYANNNSVRYSDPTGHCAWPLSIVCGAVIGAALGAVVNIGIQVAANMNNKGMSFTDAVSNINVKQVEVAAVGGAVAGAVIGAVGPLLGTEVIGGLGLTGLGEFAGNMVVGGIANVAAGQAEARLSPSFADNGQIILGQSHAAVIAEAEELGYGDSATMWGDFGKGMLTAGIAGFFKGVLGLGEIGVPDPSWGVRAGSALIDVGIESLNQCTDPLTAQPECLP
jgi:RHS repeat-associated protein